MSAARIVLGCGLLLDVLGTLFISWDVRTGQDATKTSIDVLSYIFNLGNNDESNRRELETTQNLAEAARGVESANPRAAGTSEDLDQLAEIWKLLEKAEPAARKKNQELLDGVSSELTKRRVLIWTAIAAVFVGGILEFLAGVVLKA